LGLLKLLVALLGDRAEILSERQILCNFCNSLGKPLSDAVKSIEGQLRQKLLLSIEDFKLQSLPDGDGIPRHRIGVVGVHTRNKSVESIFLEGSQTHSSAVKFLFPNTYLDIRRCRVQLVE
jgi:hypothetical protein